MRSDPQDPKTPEQIATEIAPCNCWLRTVIDPSAYKDAKHSATCARQFQPAIAAAIRRERVIITYLSAIVWHHIKVNGACWICGYRGEGFYSPAKHACAGLKPAAEYMAEAMRARGESRANVELENSNG